jgi:hypothetical protein
MVRLSQRKKTAASLKAAFLRLLLNLLIYPDASLLLNWCPMAMILKPPGYW